MGDGSRPRFVVPMQGSRVRRGPTGDDQVAGPTPAERFHALFGSAPLGVALSDLSGRFTDVNPRLRDLLDGTGIDPDDAGLGDLARQLPADGDEAQTWRDGLRDVVAGRAPATRAELLITPPDAAAPRWVQVTAALIALGDRRFLLSLVEDSTAGRAGEDTAEVTDLRETDLRETDLRETGLPRPGGTDGEAPLAERPA